MNHNLVAIGAALVVLASPAFAEDISFQRTQAGRPDLQGVWSSRWLTPVERIAGETELVVSAERGAELAKELLERAGHPAQMDPELAAPDAETLAIVRGEHRTSLIISPDDGKLPLNDAGRAARLAYISGLDGPEQRMTTERCIGGVGWAPLQIRTHAMLREIVQTDDHVVLRTEAYSDLRLVPIDAERRPDAAAPHMGESVGRWEGDTLVVETKNYDPDLSTHGIVTVMSPDAVVTEWFTPASADEIVYRYQVDDPTYYDQPWSVEYSLMRTDERVYEFACHEGNYALKHMLNGARMEEISERSKAAN